MKQHIQTNWSVTLLFFAALLYSMLLPLVALSQEVTQPDLRDVDVRLYTVEESSNGEVKKTPIVSNEDGVYVLRKYTTVGLPALPQLLGYSNKYDVIEMTGYAAPGSIVSLYFNSQDTSSLLGKADENGYWSIEARSDTLADGDYITNVRVESQEGGEYAAALAIGLDETLSNTTTIIIMACILLLVVLLLLINGYLHRRLIEEESEPKPNAALTDNSTNLTAIHVQPPPPEPKGHH